MHEDDTKNSSLLKGGKSCPAGKILREGYTATRKKKTILGRLLNRGTTYRVKASCIKGPAVIGPLKQGDLKDAGYDHTDSANKRHMALIKAVSLYGPLSTYRKLNAIAVLNKNVGPSRARIYLTDRDWVKKMFLV